MDHHNRTAIMTVGSDMPEYIIQCVQSFISSRPEAARPSRIAVRSLVRCCGSCLIELVAGGVFTGVSCLGIQALGVSGQNVSSSKVLLPAGQPDEYRQCSTGSFRCFRNHKRGNAEHCGNYRLGTVSYRTFWDTATAGESAGSVLALSKRDSKYLYIATNNHVVADADSLVQFVDNETVECKVQLMLRMIWRWSRSSIE